MVKWEGRKKRGHVAAAGLVTLHLLAASAAAVTITTGNTLSISADGDLGAAPGTPTANSIIIDGGTLQTTGTFTLNSNRGLAVGPSSGQGDGTINVVSGELAYGGIIASNGASGTGNLVKLGSGTLTLSGVNTYTGNTLVAAGALKIGNASALPSGTGKGNVTVDGTLDLNAKSITVNGLSGAGTITSTAAGSIVLTAGANNQTSTFSGTLQNGSGTLGLVKTGTGTLTLSGNNTFTGGVTINNGALQLGNAGALNSSILNSVTFGPSAAVGTKLQLNGNSVSISGLATNATPGTVVVENANASAATLTVNQSSSTTFAGTIQNGAGGGALSLTKSGAGILTLTGTNTYTGNTTITAGTLQAGLATAIPSGAGTGNVVLDGSASFAGLLDLNGFDLSINGLSGVTGSVLGKVANNKTGTNKTFTVGSGDASTTFAGQIVDHTSGTGTLNLAKAGAGTLTLNAASTYTGATTIKNGALTLGTANALPTTTTLTLGDSGANTGGILKLNGFAQSLAGIASVGSGTNRIVNGSLTAVSLTLNVAASSSFAGSLGGPGSNEDNLSIIKSGAGTLTLSGSSSYTGTTTISNGTISVGNLASGGNLGSGASAVILGDASNRGILFYTGNTATYTRGLTLSAGGGEVDSTVSGQTLTIGTGNITGSGLFAVGGGGNTSITSNIASTGGLSKSGLGTLTLSGTNSYTGATSILNGTIALGVNNGLNAATTLTLGDPTLNYNGVLKLNGFSQTLAGLAKTGNGTLNKVIGGSSTLSNLTLNIGSPTSVNVVLGGSGTNENNFTFTKFGAGALTLTGTNTYTGGTVIGDATSGNNGILAVSSDANLGGASGVVWIYWSTLEITSSFTTTRSLTLSHSSAAISVDIGQTYSVGGVVGGSNPLNLVGAGTLTLTGTSNTWSGGTNVQNGTLNLGASGTLPSSTVVTLGGGVNSGTLALNGYNQTIGGLQKSGSGSTNKVVNGSKTASTLTVSNASDYTYSGVLGGVGNNENNFGLTKSGAGTLTLSGINTYTGNTLISAGTLKVGVATAIPSGAGNGNLQVDGTLDLNALGITINGLSGSGTVTSGAAGAITFSAGSNDQTSTFSGVIQNGSGTVSFTKVGAGTLTLGGANTYTGSTTVTLGTLKVGNTAAIPFGSGKGNVSLTGSLDLNGNSITINGLSGTGAISSGVSGAVTLSVGANDQTSAYTGAITDGSGVVALTKVGTGIFTLSGGATYSGDTTISTGTLKLGASNALPDGAGKGNVVLNGALDMSNRTDTINGLTGSGTVTNNSAATTGTLTIGGNNATSDFTGLVLNNGTGVVALAKTGTGTLTLTPSANNAFTGGLTINTGGIVQLGNANALNSAGTNVVTFGASAVAATKLQLNGNSITLAGLQTNATPGTPSVENANSTPATLTVNNSAAYTYAGILADGAGGGAFSLTKSSTGTLTLSGANTYTGITTITGGKLATSADANLGTAPVSPTAGSVVINGGTLQATAAYTLAANRGLALGPTSGSGSGTLDVALSQTLTYGGIATNNSAGTGGLIKTGAGILAISGTANGYSGGTTVNGGLLSVTATSGTPLGANISGSNVSVTAGANLSLSDVSNKGTNQTITVNSSSAALGGIGFSNASLTTTQLAGMFTDSTASYGGVLGINNAISYSATLDLSTWGGGSGLGLWFLGSASSGTYNAATLGVGSGNAYRLGGGGGTLTLGQASVLTGGNDVLVGSSLTNGNGTVVDNVAQNYTGKTTVTGGAILSIGGDSSLGTVPGSATAGKIVLDNGTLQARANMTATPINANRGIAVGPSSGSGSGTIDTNSYSVNYSGIIANNASGTGAFTKAGTGTLTLTGNHNTYTGATNLNAGTVNFSGLSDLGAGNTIAFAGGTLQWAVGSNTADITQTTTGGVRTVSTASATTATLDINGNDVALANPLSGAGNVTIKDSTATSSAWKTLTLNAVSTFTGATTITSGTVKFGVAGAIPVASAVTLNSGATVAGTIDINGYDTTLKNLAGTSAAIAAKVVNNAVGTNKILTLTNAANTAFFGTIADNGGTGGTISLVKTGANSMTLSGTSNTYSSGTTISAGTLSIAGDGSIGAVPASTTAGSIVIAGGATLNASNTFTLDSKRGIAIGPSGATAATIDVTAARILTYNGIIANSGTATGGLTKTTGGTLVLGGANTYSGDTTVTAGTLKIGNVAAIPSGTGKGNVSLTGSLDLNNSAITINGLSGAGTVTSSVAGAASLTVGSNDQASSFSGVIQNGSGTVSLGKTGSGTLTLSGTSTYTGGTSITQGIVSVSADTNLGGTSSNVAIGSNGTLSVSNSFTLSSTRGIAVGPASGNGSGTIDVAATKTLTYNGIIADNGSGTGGLIKTNTTGILALGGANTYSGDTTIQGGTLQLGSASAIPSGSGKGNLSLAGTLDMYTFSPTVNGLTGAGTITKSQTGAATFSAGLNDATSSFAGVIQDGSGTVSFTKVGTGVLTLTNIQTYSSTTTISAGTLKLGIANALPSGFGKGNMTVDGTLDLAGYDQTVNALSGGGSVINSVAGTATLTVGSQNTTSTFAGNIQTNTGAVALTKTGTGVLTLSGNNTYSGATNISAGTIAVGSSTGLSPNSTITIQSIGTLDVNGFNSAIDGLLGTGTITNNGGSNVTLTAGSAGGTGTFGGVIQDGAKAIALTKGGSGTLTLTGVNTYSGATAISNGTISVANIGAGGNLGTGSAPIVLGDATHAGVLSYTGNADLSYTRGFTVNAGGGGIDGTVAGKTITLQTGGIATSGTFTVGGSGNAIIQSVISGTGGLAKGNTGSMLLSGANTYSGDTVVSTGTLQVGADVDGSGNAPIPYGSGKGNLTVNGTLDVNDHTVSVNGLSGSGTITNSLSGSARTFTAGANNSTSFGGVIQDGVGTMSFTKTGGGTLTLTNANTYSGNTTISAGTLQVGNASAIPSGAYKGNVSLAGTLDLNANSTTVNGLSGAGAVTNSAGGSPVLSVGANDQTSEFSGTISDGSGSGKTVGLTKTGGGILMLSGISTFSGATTIDQGTVSMGSDTGLSSHSTLTINNAGTLDLNGRTITIDGLAGTGVLTNNGTQNVRLTTGASGGGGIFAGSLNDGSHTIALTKTGAGTVELASTNTYSGGTVITGGMLKVYADNALGAVPGSSTPNNIVLDRGTFSAKNTFVLNANRGILIGGTVGDSYGALDADDGQTLTYAGVISNNGMTATLNKTGAGTVNLGNANTYTGDTNIQAGSLQVGNANAIPSGAGKGNVSIAGKLDLNDNSITVNGLTGTGTVSNTKSGSVVLSAGDNDQTSTFAGSINNENGTVGLTKVGAGTLTLTGVTSTYSGGTRISAGTLSISDDRNVGAVPGSAQAGNIVINGGATLAVTETLTVAAYRGIAVGPASGSGLGTVDVAASKTVSYGGIIASNASGTGGLRKAGGGTLVLSGANTHSGSTRIDEGTLSIAADANLGTVPGTVTPGHLVVNAGATLQATASFAINSNRGMAVGPTSGTGSGTVEVTGSNTVSYGGIIANDGGVGGLTKTGTGTLKVTAVNSYTGPTDIQAGTLTVNGSLAAGAGVTVQAGARLEGTDGLLVGSSVVVSGTIAPGEGTGVSKLTTGDQTWSSTGVYEVDISNATHNPAETLDEAKAHPVATFTDSDQLVMSGLTVSSGFTIKALPANGNPNGFTPGPSSLLYDWVIAQVTGGSGFSVNALNLDVSGFTGASVDRYHFSLFTVDDAAFRSGGTAGTRDMVLRYDYSAVPEATTMLLGMVGLAPLLMQRRRAAVRAEATAC